MKTYSTIEAAVSAIHERLFGEPATVGTQPEYRVVNPHKISHSNTPIFRAEKTDHTEGGKYRMLEAGEVLQKGDEVHIDGKSWKLYDKPDGVKKVNPTNAFCRPQGHYRRPLNPTPSQQKYRTLLRGEVFCLGDQMLDGSEWVPLHPLSHGCMLADCGVGRYRRPITAHETETDPERLRQQRDAWEQTAAQRYQDAIYYRGLLVQCGEAIGKPAYTADDGTTQQDVLVAKIPELVRGLAEKREDTAQLIYDIMRDEVNVVDECEKWLRAYAPEKLKEAFPPIQLEAGNQYVMRDGLILTSPNTVHGQATVFGAGVNTADTTLSEKPHRRNANEG